MRYNPIKDIRQDITRHFIVMLAINLVLLLIIAGLTVRYEYKLVKSEERIRILAQKVQIMDDIQKNIMFYR